MFPLGRTSSRRAVPVRRRMEMGSPLWVRDDDVPVDQGIRRGTRKTAIEPGFLQLQFPLRVGPPTGPGRLEHLRRGGIPCSPANPSEDVPEGVVAADDKAAYPTREGVETVSIERLQTLPARRAGGKAPSERTSLS